MDQKKGRKIKSSAFETETTTQNSTPKKRGRPKTKNLDGNSPPKGTGKRGRKPKERVYSFVESSTNPFEHDIKSINSDPESDNETLILKIPTDKEYDNRSIPEDETGPEPFENVKPRFSSYDKQIVSNIKKCIESLPSKLEDIDKEREKEAKKYLKYLSSKDIQTTFPVQELINNKEYNNNNYDSDKLTTPKEEEDLPITSKDDLFEKRSNPIDNYLSYSNVIIEYTSEYTLLPDFKESQRSGKLPEKTNIHCWWDTFPFDTQPVGYPIKHSFSNEKEITIINPTSKINAQPIRVKNYKEYPKDKFYVYGCFCSYNCLLAYVKANNIKCDHLLKYMFKIIHNKKFDTKPAPPFQALKRFGGPLSISEFRDSFDHIDYSLLKVPLIAVQPNMVERENVANHPKSSNQPSKTNFSYKNNNPSQNNTPITEQNDNLRLKRSKPLKGSRGTLENFMNIKVI